MSCPGAITSGLSRLPHLAHCEPVAAGLAGAAGLPTWTLVAGAVVACVLLLPLLVLVPSLWTLGVFDTWLAFRQRRFGRPTVQ